MGVAAGTRLGVYEVVGSLGVGGMGEVYRAQDTRLGRSIAMKVLPDAFAHDPDRVARFEREARVLASLNHPNIAALYGMEKIDGMLLLAMELVEGQTLAELIGRGPVPIVDAVKIAHQIAEALESAHEKGIIHRDLKPANVKVGADGKVKVLDFGLAKAMDSAPSNVDAVNTPTMSVAARTFAGVVLGTAAYMSPEQAKGASTDQRTDVFAFGCVLYEMLVGRRTFPGDTVTEAIASVLAREPDLNALPPASSPRLLELLRRCLEKDPKRRWHAIGDVRVELDAIIADPHGVTAAARGQRSPLLTRVVPAAVTGVVAAAIAGAAVWTWRPAPPERAITRFAYTMPKDQRFTRNGRHVLAISPDGSTVAYVANSQLYLKSMADMVARPVPGTSQDINTPVFSPDGRWVAFCAVPEGKLRKIAVTGGASVTLADIDNPYGAQWIGDNIYLGQGRKGIARVSANGGKAEIILPVEAGELAQSPQLLPDGDHLVFTVAKGAADDRWDKAQIVVQSLRTKERVVVLEGGSDARYVPTGHLVYALGGTIFGVPFSTKSLRVSGGPVPVLEGISRAASVNSGASFFAFSDNGSMVSIPGGVTGAIAPVSLAMVNRTGEKKPLPLPSRPYQHPRVSPDGKQVAVEINDGDKDWHIWMYELSGGTSMRRLTFSGRNRAPVWSRDSQRVAYRSDRDGDDSVYWQRADGSGVAERLTTAEKDRLDQPEAWSPDGKTLTFVTGGGGPAFLRMLSLDGDRKPRTLVQSKSYASNSTFSPDGRWFAYEGGDSGSAKIYVQPFPPSGAKYEISEGDGDARPLWSPDGKELFYLQNAGQLRLVAVEVRTQPSVAFGKATPLPIEGIVARGQRSYDITPDGKQFLVMIPPSEAGSVDTTTFQINVVLNWFDDLKQRAPVK